MTEMRTRKQQIRGLAVVADLLAEDRVDSVIFISGAVMDTPVLRVELLDGPEVVYAVGGYDVWNGLKGLAQTDLSADEAAAALRESKRLA